MSNETDGHDGENPLSLSADAAQTCRPPSPVENVAEESCVDLMVKKETAPMAMTMDDSPSTQDLDDFANVTDAQHHRTTTTMSCGSMVCRICQTNSMQEILISPCHCKGSMAYVHLSCLERWLNQSSRCYCELCMFNFNAIQTKRYGLFEGLKLWIRHPRNRNHIQSDVLIGALLTAITIGLVVVSLLGLQYFILEAKKLGMSRIWTQAILIGFICIVIFSYLVTVYLLVKDQVMPWYAWWTHTVDVRLLLTPSVEGGVHRQLSKETDNVIADTTNV